jgi:hypothetical protein
MAGLGGNYGELAADTLFSSGDLTGSIDRSLTAEQFNALSPAQLRAAYDVLLITWNSPEALNLDWNTRLLPFLNAGGNVIYEDPNNLSDLAPAVSGKALTTSGFVEVAPVPTLADGITGDFGNSHIRFRSWDSSLSAFLTAGKSALGLYGQFDDGRIVLTGTDQDYDGVRNSSDPAAANSYNLLLDEVRWEVAPRLTAPLSQSVSSESTSLFDLGSFRDPIANDGPWTVDVNWNDGTSPTTYTVPAQGALGSLTHAFPSEGSYRVTVTVAGAVHVAQQAAFMVTVGEPSGSTEVTMASALDVPQVVAPELVVAELLPGLLANNSDPSAAFISDPIGSDGTFAGTWAKPMGHQVTASPMPRDLSLVWEIAPSPLESLDPVAEPWDGVFIPGAFSPQSVDAPALFLSS